jgi:hypothetical protein
MNFYRVAGVLSLLLLFSISVWSAPLPTPSPNPSPSPPAKQTTESFWAMLLRISGISATPRNQRGPQTGKTGQVWVAFLDNKTRRRVATNDTGFSTPVFFPDGQSILAVQGNDVIKLSVADGSKQKVTEVKGIIKLVGFDTTDLDKVLILSDEDRDSCPTVGLLSLATGKVVPQPYGRGEGDQLLLGHLEGSYREYDNGKFGVDSVTQSRDHDSGPITWLDIVFMEQNKADVNVSLCEPKNCIQPSLSNDRKRVVYIKEP